MEIMIDNQRVVSLEADLLRDEFGELHIVLGAPQASHLLNEWVDLHGHSRAYDFGDAEATETALFIARCDTPNGRLLLERVDPFWNGSWAIDGYSLERLSQALGIDALRWGESIGSPDPLAGAR